MVGLSVALQDTVRRSPLRHRPRVIAPRAASVGPYVAQATPIHSGAIQFGGFSEVAVDFNESLQQRRGIIAAIRFIWQPIPINVDSITQCPSRCINTRSGFLVFGEKCPERWHFAGRG